MPSLESTTEELISLFPKGYPKLDVVLKSNTQNQLYAFFLQRNTLDTRRDWEAFLEFRGPPIKNKWPDTFDHLYSDCFSEIESGDIDVEDRLLLSLHLSYLGNFEGNKIVELIHIRRNQGFSLKGIGSQVFEAMTSLLFRKDFSHILICPIKGLEQYWNSLGAVPYRELQSTNQQIIPNLNGKPQFCLYYLR